MKLKPYKNSGLNGIQTHELCDTGAVLYRLSYQPNWELVTLWICNIPVEDDYVNEYMKKNIYIWTAEKHMKTWLINAVMRYQCSALPTPYKMVEISMPCIIHVSLTQLLIGISFSVPEFLEWHTVPVQCIKALFKIIELHKA